MAKFSERARQKAGKKEKTGVSYALGCLILIVLVPVMVFGYTSIKGKQTEERRKERVKTKFYEGLTASVDKKWAIKGYEIAEKERQFTLKVKVDDKNIPTDDLTVQYKVVDGKDFLGTMTQSEKDKTLFTAKVLSDQFDAGQVEIEAVAESATEKGKKWTSTTTKINVSYPLYVAWTMDWEGRPASNVYMQQMTAMRKQHKNIPMTHFFNPRIWVGGVGAADAQNQLNYVKEGKRLYGDEIGLHLHMWTDLVRAAGVTPRTSPAWDSKGGTTGSGGYDVPCSAYPYEEFLKILEFSKRKFKEHGLATPVSFRAGGWYADLENIKALEKAGFTIDSSGRDARNWWKGYFPTEWSLGSTSQPYKVSKESLNSSEPAPTYNVWEMPNNGSDSYWYTKDHLLTAFNDNFRDQQPLKDRRMLNYLTHPHWFNVDRPKLDALFKLTDSYHYTSGNGPVYYTTLEKYISILEKDPERQK